MDKTDTITYNCSDCNDVIFEESIYEAEFLGGEFCIKCISNMIWKSRDHSVSINEIEMYNLFRKNTLAHSEELNEIFLKDEDASAILNSIEQITISTINQLLRDLTLFQMEIDSKLSYMEKILVEREAIKSKDTKRSRDKLRTLIKCLLSEMKISKYFKTDNIVVSAYTCELIKELSMTNTLSSNWLPKIYSFLLGFLQLFHLFLNNDPCEFENFNFKDVNQLKNSIKINKVKQKFAKNVCAFIRLTSMTHLSCPIKIHPSDKYSIEKVEIDSCVICFEIVKIDQFATFSDCSHKICMKCINTYFITIGRCPIEDGKPMNSLILPYKDNSQTLYHLQKNYTENLHLHFSAIINVSLEFIDEMKEEIPIIYKINKKLKKIGKSKSKNEEAAVNALKAKIDTKTNLQRETYYGKYTILKIKYYSLILRMVGNNHDLFSTFSTTTRETVTKMIIFTDQFIAFSKSWLSYFEGIQKALSHAQTQSQLLNILALSIVEIERLTPPYLQIENYTLDIISYYNDAIRSLIHNLVMSSVK